MSLTLFNWGINPLESDVVVSRVVGQSTKALPATTEWYGSSLYSQLLLLTEMFMVQLNPSLKT